MGRRAERVSNYYNEHPAHIFLPVGIGGGLVVSAMVLVFGDHSRSGVVVAIIAGLASIPLFMMVLAVIIGLGGALAETIEDARRRRR